MTYDLVVIGSGPGGYVCAIRAAQLGMKVAVVEKMKTLGGTCLNIGCIPSKALLYASEMFDEAGHGLAPLGVVVSPPKLDLPAMMKHKDVTVAANVNGVAYLFKKNKIDWVSGEGRIAAPGRVTVKGRRRQGERARNESDRHRDGIRRRSAAGRGDRREDDRLLDRRVEPACAAEEAHCRGRRRHRARTRLGLAAGGFRSDGGGVPRPCPDGDRWRGRQADATHARKAGLCLSPRS